MIFKKMILIFTSCSLFSAELIISSKSTVNQQQAGTSNQVTKQTSDSSNQSLSSGAIAGIVIGGIVIGLSPFAIYKLIKNKSSNFSTLSLIEIEALAKMPLTNTQEAVDFLKSIQILLDDKSEYVQEFYFKIKDKKLKDFLKPNELVDLSNTNVSIHDLITTLVKNKTQFTQEFSELMKKTSIKDLTPLEKAEFLLKKLFFENENFIKYADSSTSWFSKIWSNKNERKAKTYASLVADIAENTGVNAEDIFDFYRTTFLLNVKELESLETRGVIPTSKEETEVLRMTKKYEAAYRSMIETYKAKAHSDIVKILKFTPENLKTLGSITTEIRNIYFKDPSKEQYYEYDPKQKQFVGTRFEKSNLETVGKELILFDHPVFKSLEMPKGYILVKV